MANGSINEAKTIKIRTKDIIVKSDLFHFNIFLKYSGAISNSPKIEDKKLGAKVACVSQSNMRILEKGQDGSKQKENQR